MKKYLLILLLIPFVLLLNKGYSGGPLGEGPVNSGGAIPGVGVEVDPVAGAINGIVVSDGAGNFTAFPAYTPAQVRTYINVENGATADQTGAEIKTLYEAEPNAFTDAQFTKLGTIAPNADVTGANAPQAHAASHTDGTDDIQDATNAQKGLATAAQITAVEANTLASHAAATINANATAGGMSLVGQEINNRAATNAQTGYATAGQITAIEANTLKVGVTTEISNLSEDGTPELGGNLDTLTYLVQGSVFNDQMTNAAGADILGLNTEPVFLNLLCEDPGAGTMTDISTKGHDGTYTGTWITAQRLMEGFGWVNSFNGSDDYIDLGDSADFSFGDASNDSPVTFFGVIEITDTAASKYILTKHDITTGTELREWYVLLENTEKIRLQIYDNSAAVYCNRRTTVGISVGWHSVVITYDGAGGATAANTIIIYIDGEVEPSIATNDGAYVAMEDLAVPVWIGAYEAADGNPAGFFPGDIAQLGIDKGYVWSALDVNRYHQRVKGLYNL